MIKFIFKVSFVFLILAGCGLAMWGREDFARGQTFTREMLTYPIIITDRNDIEIHRIFGNENREWIPLDAMPELLQEATILAEDKRFKYHFGVDFIGIARAMVINFKTKRFSQGASSLSQQISKKIFLSDEKTYERKLHEMFIAMGIEYKFTKEEIMETYLNTVPYGARENGIKVASEFYFNKSPKDLTEAEILVLTMLPQNPVLLSRKRKVKDWLGSCPLEQIKHCDILNPFYNRTRIEEILVQLGEEKNWPAKKTLSVWKDLEKIKLPQSKNWVFSDFQHFQFYVRDFLADKDINFFDVKDGIVIKTSLDAPMQQELYAYLREEASTQLKADHDINNLAFIALDNESRKPLVWIGSKYFWNDIIDGQIDMLRSQRQVGSTIKPFVYEAAIEQGYQPPTIIYDSSVYFRGDSHTLRNSDGHYLGGIRMTDALAKSRNIPAAKMMILAGGESKVRNYLDKTFGFEINKNHKNHRFGWTLSLGTPPIEIKNLANGYATMATGKRKELCPILSIKTFGGNNLGNICSDRIIATVSDEHKFFINDILSNVSARPWGYKWRENLTLENFNLAVKTGTSSKRVNGVLLPADNVIAGYSPKNTFLMWAGNTDGKAFNGGSVSVMSIGPVWKKAVEKFYDKHPETYASFQRPDNLQKIHGEWATLDYTPPSYEPLGKVVWYNKEKGLNPLIKLAVKAPKKEEILTMNE